MEPVSIYIGDGFLHISETQDCAHYVEYENKLAPADALVTHHDFENLDMMISRGYGSTPDTLIIFNKVTKSSYSITVDDDATGFVCVPWPLIG